MACELNNYTKGACAENGGIEEMYVYSIADRTSYTLTSGVVTDIVLANGTKAVTWTPDMESATAGEVTTRSRENNSVFQAQTGLIVFKDDSDVTVDIVNQVARGFLGVIVKKATADGSLQYRHYGLINGMTVETAEGVLGQLYEDLRGHTLNLVGKELTKAPSVDSSVITTILVPVS